MASFHVGFIWVPPAVHADCRPSPGGSGGLGTSNGHGMSQSQVRLWLAQDRPGLTFHMREAMNGLGLCAGSGEGLGEGQGLHSGLGIGWGPGFVSGWGACLLAWAWALACVMGAGVTPHGPFCCGSDDCCEKHSGRSRQGLLCHLTARNSWRRFNAPRPWLLPLVARR